MATMTPDLRKLALTAHVTSSVGWLGRLVRYRSVERRVAVDRPGPVIHGNELVAAWVETAPLPAPARGTELRVRTAVAQLPRWSVPARSNGKN